MKTDSELLKIAIDNYKDFCMENSSGLCRYLLHLSTRTYYNGVKITDTEYQRLLELIYSNIKKRNLINIFSKKSNIAWWSFGRNNYIFHEYFWRPFNHEPRLRYLEWLYEKYSKL